MIDEIENVSILHLECKIKERNWSVSFAGWMFMYSGSAQPISDESFHVVGKFQFRKHSTLRFINAPNSSSYFLSVALIFCVAEMLQFAEICMVAR